MLVLADALALALALALSRGISDRWSWEIAWLSATALSVLLLGARLSGLHEPDEGLLRKTTLEEVPKIFQLATLCVLVTWLAAGLFGNSKPDPTDVLELWLALSSLLILTRIMARLADLQFSAAERCVFIGDEPTERLFCSKLQNHSRNNTTVVARIEIDEFEDWKLDGDFTDRVAKMRHLAQVLGVQRAVVAPSGVNGGGVLDLLRTLQASGIRISVLPGQLDVPGPSLEFGDLHGMTVLRIRQFRLNRSSALCKRAYDLVGTLLALLALAPLMIAIAIAIKLDTRGPVFFRQLRVGRRGLRFRMLKFRTMVRDAESLKDSLADRNQALSGLFKISDDPRITRVGKLLRKTSLDELPQLLNVLRGEMSLVGPRPLILEEDSRVEGWQRQRLEMLPGMTGPWQVLGPVRVSLREMANIDNRYLLNRSLWTDITILLRTTQHILGRRGL